MGLFDNKETKKAKEIYKKLVALKDNSYELKNILPATEKEFLKSPNKEKMISVYEYTQEIMKRQDILEVFNLKNMGECYDFVVPYYNTYVIKQERSRLKNQLVETDFMKFLESSISGKLLEYKTQQQIDNTLKKTEAYVADLEGRLQTADTSQEQRRLDEIARQEATKIVNVMKENEFKKSFPQYDKLRHAIALYKLGIGENNPIVIAIKEKIAYGKEEIGIPNLEFNDLLMPYLDQKFRLGILTSEEEKIYYKTTTGNNEIELKKRLFSLSVNASIFFQTYQEQNEFMESFEETKKIINDLNMAVKGPKR